VVDEHMRAYYDRRSAEYDDWWLGTGGGIAVPLPFSDGEFDRVFTSRFCGHLLPDERDAFLREARRAARELVVVDSAVQPDLEAEQWQERVLGDGSRHRVYKRVLLGADLAEELGNGRVLHEGRWFVVAAA
jgi:Methyltransferase domain